MPVSRFVIRFHLVMIVLSTLAAGLLSSRLMLKLGLENMALRYAIAAILAYDVFLLLGRFWLAYISSRARLAQPGARGRAKPHGDREGLDREDVVETTIDGADVLYETASGESSTWETPASISEGSSWSDMVPDSFDVDDGIGAIFLVLIVVIAAILIAGGLYLVVEVQLLLLESAFHAVLTAAFIRALNRVEKEEWALSLAKETWLPFALTLLLAIGCGYWAQKHCPTANTLSQVFTCR